MPTDQNERPITGPEHQFAAPQPRQHKFASVIVWIVLLLVFAAAFYLVLRKHEDSAANARAPRGGGGPATVVTATATCTTGKAISGGATVTHTGIQLLTLTGSNPVGTTNPVSWIATARVDTKNNNTDTLTAYVICG